MYYNYNIPNYRNNMRYRNNKDERFGGFVGPLLLGGLAGYAIGNNGFNNNQTGIIYPIYPYQTPYYYPYYSTSNYYYY